MPTPLETLKRAESELYSLTQAFPSLDLALDHRLRLFFPKLPEDICTDFLFVNKQTAPQAGQTPVIVSQSISALIDECFLTGRTPTFEQGISRVYNYAYTVDDEDVATGITAPELEKYLEFVTQYTELCVRDALRDFWQTPHKDLNSLTPRYWLSQFCQSMIRAEAVVRHEDTTLNASTMVVIDETLPTTASLAALQGHNPYGFYKLNLDGHVSQGSTALYGLFVITTRDLPGASDDTRDTRIIQDATSRPVVLYSPDNGLESFDSLAALTQELKARLKDPYQRDTLLNYVLEEERVQALAHEHVNYSPVPSKEVPTFYASQLIEKQRRDMQYAWSQARARNPLIAPDQLSETVEQSLIASMPLKPAAILRNRYTRLLEKQLPDWLRSASDDKKTEWRLAVEHLNHERLAAQDSHAEPLSVIGQKQTLLGYARLQLRQSIKQDHGIDVNPDSLFISTTEAVRTGPLINPVSGSGFAAGVSLEKTGPAISYQTTRRSLSELALSNVGIWDVTFALTAQVKDDAGMAYPMLTSHYLKALVRKLDIGETYKKKLYDLLINSRQAQWRKERYVALKKAQMSLDLLEARLSGALNEDQVARVKTALDQPVEKNRSRFKGEQVLVHLLMIRYKPLPGLLVFSSTGSQELICYTPDAPDNRWFMIATSRNELGRLLSHARWRTYVMQRVTTAQQAYVRPLLEQGLTDSHLQLQGIAHHLFEASYDTQALHAIRDADEQSTSTWESNLNTAKETALTVIDVVSFVLPVRILLPIVLARFIHQIFKGLDALQRDEQHEALLQFMESITHLTDAASDFTGSSIFSKSIRQRIAQNRPTLSQGAASSPPHEALMLRTGDEFGAGIYESNAPAHHHYIKNTDGHLYRCQYDNLDELWRALDERKLDATYSIPLRELSAGLWDVDPTAPLLKQKPGIERVIESARVSDINLTAQTPDEQGIYRLNGKRYIQQNNTVFEVYSGWLGRGWYLHIAPGSSSGTRGSFKVRRTAGQWEVKHRLQSGTKRWEPLTYAGSGLPTEVPAVRYSEYDMPDRYKETLQNIIRNHPHAMDTGNDFLDLQSELSIAHRTYKTLRTKLHTDAKAYFQTVPAQARVIRPQMPANISEVNLMKRMHEQCDGIILGETHSHQSGKKLLIDHMAELARNDVKTLYLEHLQTDFHQSLLDEYFISGKMPLRLDEFLKEQDLGHGISPTSPYNFSQLIRQARRHRVEVIALDCSASYYNKGIQSETPWLTRYELFSYFASQVIRTHQAKTGNTKWIALTGNSHTNTFDGVPGLAELLGAVGTRVSDSVPGSSRGLLKDIGEVLPANHIRLFDRYLKNDYWLQVDIAGTKPRRAALTPAQISDMLKSPGYFRFQNSPTEGAQLVHRSSQNELVYTPLQTDPGGQIFIERSGWPTIHQKRFDALSELIRALRDIQMVHIK